MELLTNIRLQEHDLGLNCVSFISSNLLSAVDFPDLRITVIPSEHSLGQGRHKFRFNMSLKLLCKCEESKSIMTNFLPLLGERMCEWSRSGPWLAVHLLNTTLSPVLTGLGSPCLTRLGIP